VRKLHQCPLFQGISPDEVDHLLSGRFNQSHYNSGEVVAFQASRYESLLLVAQGRLRGEMTDEWGRATLIEEIAAPRVVAPAFLYASQNALPVTLIAMEPTVIVSIRKRDFTEMMQQEARLLTNFLQSMSDRSRFLSDRLYQQRFGTIRSKLVGYLREISKQQNGASHFVIPDTQQQLADRFGVTRPALARGIAQLEADGIIRYERNHFELLDNVRLKKG
jgi:CRP/FNR family transcriptional regulator, dissimilatory nitrate respiration regulator